MRAALLDVPHQLRSFGVISWFLFRAVVRLASPRPDPGGRENPSVRRAVVTSGRPAGEHPVSLSNSSGMSRPYSRPRPQLPELRHVHELHQPRHLRHRPLPRLREIEPERRIRHRDARLLHHLRVRRPRQVSRHTETARRVQDHRHLREVPPRREALLLPEPRRLDQLRARGVRDRRLTRRARALPAGEDHRRARLTVSRRAPAFCPAGTAVPILRRISASSTAYPQGRHASH
jgi:hypothetical protein